MTTFQKTKCLNIFEMVKTIREKKENQTKENTNKKIEKNYDDKMI